MKSDPTQATASSVLQSGTLWKQPLAQRHFHRRIYTQLDLNPGPSLLDRFTARCVLKYETRDIAAGICNLWPLIVHYVPSLSLRGDRRVSTSPPELQ